MLLNLPPLQTGSDESDQFEEEKETKRPRSTSTTPKSHRGLEPIEYDRLMEVPQLDPLLEKKRMGRLLTQKTLMAESLTTRFRDLFLILTAGFLYGAGAETLIFVTGTSRKHPKLFVSRQKNQSQLRIPRKPRKIGVWVSGAEIQTSAVDTRTAVWVSTPEKISKIVLGKTRNSSRKFRGVSVPALYKNPAVKFWCCGKFEGELEVLAFWKS